MKLTSQSRHRGRGEGLNLREVRKQTHFRVDREDVERRMKRERLNERKLKKRETQRWC